MKPRRAGGGWAAVRYTLAKANQIGWLNLWRAMRSRNACKTCALGMGGQLGGMRNETGHFPEVCKKSLQAMVADMQGALSADFFARYDIDQLKTLTPRELETAGRLTQPVVLEPGSRHYRSLSWDDAIGRVAGKLRTFAPDDAFFYFSGRSSNEAGFLLQLFARLHGTNNVNNCSFYCHQASGVGLAQALGTGTATVTLEDLNHCDLFILIGGNPASNHPRLMRTLMEIRRRGGNVIAVNPVREIGLVNFAVPSDAWSLLFGSKITSLYLQPHIGGDIAVMSGVAKILLERSAIEETFLRDHTEGATGFIDSVKAASWPEIERRSGVDRAAMERFADMYAKSRNAVFGWTMGITHHEHGVENVRMIVNLALLRGMVGRPGAGLLPIRGHSNVQGIGSVGVTPVLKDAIFDRLQRHFGVKLPTRPGLDTMATMDAATRGEVKVGFCLGGNLFGSNPDANAAATSLGRLDQITYLSTTLNTGHAWGLAKETIILPVLARDEEPQPTTQESMFNYVRLSDGGTPRDAGPRAEVAVIADLARRVLGDHGPVDFRSMEEHKTIRQAIAAIVPGYEKIASIDETKKEFHVAGRTFHEPRFATRSGRAQFAPVDLPPLRGEPGQLRLMTVRSEGQFNTVVYEEEDLYRHQERRDVILLHAADIAERGLKVDQLVTVRGPAGVLPNILVREFDIRAGNALMYYPEANVLVPKDLDPQSKTPAFKSVLITLEPQVEAIKPRRDFVNATALDRSAPAVSAGS